MNTINFLRNVVFSTATISTSFAHADSPKPTIEQYIYNIDYKLGIQEEVSKKYEKFETEKRDLTKEEVFAQACYYRDFFKETSWYVNHYPDYKKKLKDHKFKMGLDVNKIDEAYDKYKNLIINNQIPCDDSKYTPPPYDESVLRWKEITKVNGESDLTIKYIDSETIDFISRKPMVKTVKTRELFKKYPDNIYIEIDYIIYCDSKEYEITRNKTYRNIKGDPLINYELVYNPPLDKSSVKGTISPIYEMACK